MFCSSAANDPALLDFREIVTAVLVEINSKVYVRTKRVVVWLRKLGSCETCSSSLPRLGHGTGFLARVAAIGDCLFPPWTCPCPCLQYVNYARFMVDDVAVKYNSSTLLSLAIFLENDFPYLARAS
jgi:hypothetical protein